jgi:hypothetical protein
VAQLLEPVSDTELVLYGAEQTRLILGELAT